MPAEDVPLAAPHTVHQLFEEQVRTRPASIAVEEIGGERFSYQELNGKANRLARTLRDRGIRQGDLVGVHLRRSADCVVAMLAVLKAGAGYVPLELDLPDERLRWMAEDCGLRGVITGDPGDWRLTDTAELALSALSAQTAAQPAHDLDVTVDPEDVCYVPYTSGSTGRPKGTAVPHRAVPGFFMGTAYAGWTEDATVLMHSSLSWDGHVLELYPALSTGGRVVIPTGTERDPLAVANAARSNGVTTLFLTTAAFNVITSFAGDALAGVRHLLFGGEAVSVEHVRAAAAALPHTSLVHCYGPSECTAFVSVHPVSDSDLASGIIPIGREIGDRRVHVLDDEGRPVADGGTGEAFVGGPSLGHGYLGRSALTAERFVPDPFAGPGARMYRTGDMVRRRPDGTLEFVGRTDNQVKLRGYRIELGEIEAALDHYPGIVGKLVTVHEFAPGDRRLAAYLTVSGPGPSLRELEDHLASRLPGYMIPASVTVLDSFPLTANGKIDRGALPPPVPAAADGTGRPDYEAPSNRTEAVLADTWQAVLRLDRVGRGDSFSSLGGNSLLATMVISRIRGALGVELPIRTVFEAPTLAALATALEEVRSSGAAVPAPITRVRRERPARPSSPAQGTAARAVMATEERKGSTLR